MNTCKTCNHTLCIGTSTITGKQVYECHKTKGKSRYMGYGEAECNDHVEKNPRRGR